MESWKKSFSLEPGLLLFHGSIVLPVKIQFSSGQSLSHVRLFVTPWIAARQAFLSIKLIKGS